MNISLNWLKEFIAIEEAPEVLSDTLTQTGLEVEGLEHVEKIPGGLKGVVIGEVLECKQHPNADKLKITQVDIGQEQPSPIVCGAPNVAKGQKVLVATVNSTIYPTGHDPIKIKKAKIRGEVSMGMICAEDELGLGTSHDGIMVLETDLPNGTPAAKYLKPEEDWVFEIGLTPNRGDAASHLGTARDIRAVTGRGVSLPEVPKFDIQEDRPIEVKVENAEACPRYSGVTIRGVKIQPSPDWLQWKLRAIGLEPINNIVDITNYICHGFGQPMHAFDAAAVKGDKVIIRTLPSGTSFTTLDEKERSLHQDDLMICNDQEGMCIAGVFGGTDSGIKDSTTDIFLESAYFSAEYIRNSVQRHGITTDSSFRYERGADPDITLTALKYAASLILELAGGKIASDFIDIHTPVEPVRIRTPFAYFNRLIGNDISKDRIIAILESLDIQCADVSEESFEAVVPPYRNDVTRKADLVEEVLRIYGFNNIEIDEHSSTSYLAEFNEVEPYKLEERLSHFLAGKGYHEILTNSLTHPDYQSKAKVDALQPVEILNKSSEELAYMKTSPVHSGLEVVRHNINRKMSNLKLFEFAKTYSQNKKGYQEKRHLCLYLTGHLEEENWQRPNTETQFQDLMGPVTGCLEFLGVKDWQHETLNQNALFAGGLSLVVNNQPLGEAGLIAPKLCNYFDIKQKVWYARLDWDGLVEHSKSDFIFSALPKFPEVRRDLSLVIDKNISFDRIEEIAFKSAKKLLNRINIFSVYEGDKLEEGKKSYAVSFFLQDETKTLNDKLIDKVMNKLMADYEQEVGAVIRK